MIRKFKRVKSSSSYRKIGKVFISEHVSFALAIEVLERNNA